MPKLSGEELSKLYPQAKTYDELHAEHEAIQEARRPKFVIIKIATCTALIAAVVFGIYRIALLLLPLFESVAVGSVMIGVCALIGSAVIGLAAAYYLYSLIDGLASKVFPSTTPLYFILLVILCACGGIGALLLSLGYSLAIVALSVILLAFLLSLVAASVFSKLNT